MKIISIIPARGGSKGIPQKNLQRIGGYPLIYWSINASLNSNIVNRTVVSTDDAAIAQLSEKYGAEVVMRPDELSGDSASSESALLHVITSLQEKENYHPDLIVFLQCTSPLTISEDIDRCIKKLITEKADTATAVSDFHYFVWEKQYNETGIGINHDLKNRPRRQDREPQFLETGAVYVMKTEGFMKHKHRFFGKTVLSEMPSERVQEIDEPIDLLLAEVKIRELLKKQKYDVLPENLKAVVFDFDGVMTDNKVYLNEEGVESVCCDRGDGMGISQLLHAGYRLAVMSTETNSVVKKRCKKLGIECFNSLGDSKSETLKTWCVSNKIDLKDIVFVGNDINDMESMKISACAVVPADANELVKPLAHLILNNRGGQGAVRELCDLILKLK